MNLSIVVEQPDKKLALFGSSDRHLRMIRETFGVQLVSRDDELKLSGDKDQVAKAAAVLEQMQRKLRRQDWLSAEDVGQAIGRAAQVERESHEGEIDVYAKGHQIKPKTEGQRAYIDAIFRHDLTFCVGPAGTGKTYLAVAAAASLLKHGQARRIVLARPAVEAGERLGFLPGDLQAKVNPYLRPLFDALHDMIDFEQVKRFMVNDVIEVIPLAFMRGRAQPLTSRVLTPDGFRPIGSLRVGNEVIGSDGQPTRVQGVFPQGLKEIYRVTFTDGASTRCCGDHLWTVYTPEDKRRHKQPRVLETREMVGHLRRFHNHRYEIPLLSAPVEFPARDVPMDGYALGLLLGDGCITGKATPAFATTEPELVGARMHDSADAVRFREQPGGGQCPPYAAGRHPVGRALPAMWPHEHPSTKFVPDEYLHNSADVRLAVLRGLLDTDGGPVRQEGRTSRIQYTTSSPRLRDDVRFLVRSLGGVATSRVRAKEGRTPGLANGRAVPYRSDAYVLDIRLPASIRPFRLRRKAARYEEGGVGRPMRYVHAIERDGAEEAVCIKVAATDSLYVTDDFILTHNTLNDSVIILDEAQNTTPSQMLMFLTRLGHDSKMIITGDTSQVDLPPNTRSGLVDAVEKLRGIKGIGMVELDRADIVRHRLVQNIVNAYERLGGVSDQRPDRGRGDRAAREDRPGQREQQSGGRDQQG